MQRCVAAVTLLIRPDQRPIARLIIRRALPDAPRCENGRLGGEEEGEKEQDGARHA